MSAASPRGAVTLERPPVTTAPASAVARRAVFTPVVWAVLLGELAWAVSGLTAAMLGVFSLPLVLVAWPVVGAGLWIASRPARRNAGVASDPATRWLRVAAVAVALTAAVGNAMLPGEHLQTGRDGGTYTATAGWIASDGGLLIDAQVPPFDDADGLGFDAAGFHAMVTDGPLYAQFMHAFPAMMATVAEAAGLDAMVRLNGVLGGVALLALYAFGERLVRPWAALLTQLAMAGNLVFVYFTRAPFSELLMFAMLFGGLWALDQAVGLRDRTVGFLAGLLLGATFLARLDGLVVLLMLALALLPPLVTGRLRRVAPAALAGIAAMSAFAAIDLFVFAPFYVTLHVEFLVPLGLAFALVGLVALAAVTRRGRRLVRLLLAHRARLATATAALIVVAGVYAYVVRPEIVTSTWGRTTPIGWLQQREGEAVNEARTYAEQAARWLGWYLGLPTLVAGWLGWAGLVRSTIRRRVGRLTPFLLTLSGLLVLYVWRPSITPDHIWADRRFLPVVYPGLLLCAGWLLDRLWDLAAATRARTAARAAVAVVAVLVVALPLRLTLPVADLHEEAGLADDVAAACARLGDDAAILLLDEDGTAMHYRATQPLRSHCGIPAAWAPERISDARLAELEARAGDRTLYLLAERREAFDGRPVDEPFTLIAHRSTRLEPTLTAPPQDLEGYGLGVLAARVRPGAAPAVE
jgi:hypothetical protein